MIRFVISFALLVAGPSAFAQRLSFTPYHENGVYEIGETAGWTVAASPGAPAAKHAYIVRRNNSDVIQSGALDLSSGTARIETKLNEPGMIYVEVSSRPVPVDSGEPQIGLTHLGAAVAPWKLQPAVARPADFDSFWDGKLAQLREIPIRPVLTPKTSDRPGVELYEVTLDSVGSHVRGYLAKPARPGRFPALVVYQYAGVYALNPQTVTDRAAEGWLALDVDSHDIPPDSGEGVSRSYQAIGNTDRETSYFLNMYLRDARALDYMMTRPDWDAKTLVITGTSMGGQQSLAVAGLHSGITAVIVNEPAGADSNGDLHGRKAGYPNWPSSDPRAMQTGLYFDTVNFAPRIKAPVMAAIGWIDVVCPPVGIWTAINQIPGPTEVIPMVESNHNNLTPDKQEAFIARSKQVMELLLAGGEYQPNEELTRRKR